MDNRKKSSDNKNSKNDNKQDFQWKRAGKTSFIWIVIILVTVYFSSILSESRNNEVEIDYTEYKHYLNDGLIQKAVIINKKFHGEFKSPQTIDTPLGVRDDIEKFRLTIPFIDREVTEKWLNKHGFKFHGMVMGKPRGGNYHWIDNHLVKATRYNGKFTDLIDKKVTIEVFDDGQNE